MILLLFFLLELVWQCYCLCNEHQMPCICSDLQSNPCLSKTMTGCVYTFYQAAGGDRKRKKPPKHLLFFIYKYINVKYLRPQEDLVRWVFHLNVGSLWENPNVMLKKKTKNYERWKLFLCKGTQFFCVCICLKKFILMRMLKQ